MKPSELKDRTRKFSVSVIKLVEQLPATVIGQSIAEPMVKVGLTVGSKYRTICHAPNPYCFMERLAECREAADECVYWLDLILEAELLGAEEVEPARTEARRLRRIFSKSHRAASKRQRDETYRRGPGSGEDDIPF